MINRQILPAMAFIVALTAVAGASVEQKELTVFTAASLTGAFSEIGGIF